MPNSRLNATEHQVTNSKGPTLDLALMVAVKALLIACGLEGCPATQLFDEVDVVQPPVVLLGFRVLARAR